MFRQPVLVYAGDGAALTRGHGRVLSRGLCAGVYTEELFETTTRTTALPCGRCPPTD